MKTSLALSLVVILAACAPEKKTIVQDSTRTLDFKNASYPFPKDPWSESSDSGEWEWQTVDPYVTVTLVNGDHRFPEEGYVMLRSVTYGDLNGDGREEAAVDLLFGSGGTANWHYLYVYTLESGQKKLLGRLRSGERAYGGLVRVAIDAGRLILDFEDSQRAQAACCSLGFIRVSYLLDKDTFKETPPRTKGSFRLRNYPTDLKDVDIVKVGPGGNLVYVSPLSASVNLTTSAEDSDPSVSSDRTAVVFIRRKSEVWTVNIDASKEQRVFSCAPSDETRVCHSPQFSHDGRFIYVVREISEDSGALWRIDRMTGKGEEFIPDSAKFGVVQNGRHTGSIVADQRTVIRDSDGTDYSAYPYFLFTEEGTRVRRVAEDVEYLPDVLDELNRNE